MRGTRRRMNGEKIAPAAPAWSVVFILFSIVAFSVSAQEISSDVVRRIEPAVVAVTTYDGGGKVLSQGSGFFIRPGFVLTVRRLVEGARRVTIKTADERTFSVQAIAAAAGAGDVSGLVFLQTDASANAIPFLALTRELPQKRDTVFVISSPRYPGQTRSTSSVVAGTVAAIENYRSLGRVIQVGQVIHISAPLSSNNQGSPVINAHGQVIGILTASQNKEERFNLAIPAERIAALEVGSLTPLVTDISSAEGRQQATPNASGSNISDARARANEVVKKGDELLTHNPAKALSHYRLAVTIDPGYADAWVMIGHCYKRLQRYGEAVEAFKEAIRAEPCHFYSHFSLASLYRGELKRFADAIAAYEKIIQLWPNEADGYYALAELLHKDLKQYEAAVKYYKQVAARKPDYAVYENLGELYKELGEYDAALDAYGHALRFKPDNYLAYLGRGQVFSKMRRYEEALGEYRRALRLEPDSVWAPLYVGKGLIDLGRYQEAVEVYVAMLAKYPKDSAVRYHLGVAYISLGNKTAALEQHHILKTLDTDLANKLFRDISR